MEKEKAHMPRARHMKKKTRFKLPFIFKNNIYNPDKIETVKTIKKTNELIIGRVIALSPWLLFTYQVLIIYRGRIY